MQENLDDVKYLVEVPEQIIIDSAHQLSELEGTPFNSFTACVQKAEYIKKLGCTPAYMYDYVNSNVYVVIKETFRKKLH